MKNSASCIPDPSPFPPDSPDETASGQLRTPILIGESKSYDGSGGGVPTDPTGERRNRQFAQNFRSLRSCLSNLSEESGLILHISFLMTVGRTIQTHGPSPSRPSTSAPRDRAR